MKKKSRFSTEEIWYIRNNCSLTLVFFGADYPLWYSPVQAFGYYLYDFMILGALLGVLGLATFLTNYSRRYWYVFIVYACFLFFAISYQLWDQSVFYLPSLTIFSIFIGYGVLKLLQPIRSRSRVELIAAVLFTILVISPPLVYSGLPKWIASLDIEQ